MKFLSARLLAVVAVLSLIGNVLLYMRYSTNRPLVTVGNEAITKKQYQDQLEHQGGQAVLSKMVLEKLVTQAATRDGVLATTKDVDDRIASVERRAPQLLTPYQQDPAKMAEFRQDLLTNISLENLRIKNIKLTPAELAAYYTEHKGEFALPEQVKTTTVVTRSTMDAATATDLLKQHTPSDVIARQPRLNVIGMNGFNPNLDLLSTDLKRQINVFVQQAKTGDVRTFHVSDPKADVYLTFAVTSSNRAAIPPLTQIHDQVDRAARLARAVPQDQEMAQLYQAAKPTFSADKYAAYFDTIQNYSLGKGDTKKTATVP